MMTFNYDSIQELIVKAALYDGISTTISAYEDHLIGRRGDVLKITFSRDDRCSTTYIDLVDSFVDAEEVSLYGCKRALYDLLCAPYKEITHEEKK